MADSNRKSKSGRGLANADKQTRERVAREGGKARARRIEEMANAAD